MAYATAGEIIGRAAVRSGAVAMNQAQIAAFDPFGSVDQNILLMVDLLRDLGDDLKSRLPPGLIKTGTILTALAANSYPLPADYVSMVPGTAWEGTTELNGPIGQAYSAYLQAWTAGATVEIPYEQRGPSIYFPVPPDNGLTITFRYVSSYWVMSNGATAGDKAYPTAALDTVLFDDALTVLGLRLRFREAKGFDTMADLDRYNERLETVKGQVSGAPVLDLGGQRTGIRWLDESNLPDTGYGP